MKNKNLLFLPLLLIAFSIPVHADSLESVRVVKFWDTTNDLVIERESGERLLIQHHKSCSTFSTEFPVNLVWNGGEVVRMKVAANEICDVDNWAPYSSDTKILNRIVSSNMQIPTHIAQLEWQGDLYEVDYSEGCSNMRDYENHVAYLNTHKDSLEGAILFLPKSRGQCEIKKATLLKKLNVRLSQDESMIKNLRIKAENNQVFFSWDAFPEDDVWIALVTYSKYKFNPSEYTLNQMPNLRRARTNSLKVSRLVNNQKYYFYIASSNGSDSAYEWKEIEITPRQTATRFINKPDPEKFEIEMSETDDTYVMNWPDKGEVSRKYLIQVYIDGVREIFKLIDVDKSQFIFEKRPEWATSRFRMTVRSIPKKPTGLKYFDSIFWRKG